MQSGGLIKHGRMQEFGAALHGFGEWHGGWFDGAKEIEARAQLLFGLNRASKGGNGLFELSCHVGDTHGAFAVERLGIEAAFASDDEIGGGDAIA